MRPSIARSSSEFWEWQYVCGTRAFVWVDNVGMIKAWARMFIVLLMKRWVAVLPAVWATDVRTRRSFAMFWQYVVRSSKVVKMIGSVRGASA